MISRGDRQCSHETNAIRETRRSQQKDGRMEMRISKRECGRFHGGDAVVLKPERTSLGKTDGGEGIYLRMDQFSLLHSTFSYHHFFFFLIKTFLKKVKGPSHNRNVKRVRTPASPYPGTSLLLTLTRSSGLEKTLPSHPGKENVGESPL